MSDHRLGPRSLWLITAVSEQLNSVHTCIPPKEEPYDSQEYRVLSSNGRSVRHKTHFKMLGVMARSVFVQIGQKHLSMGFHSIAHAMPDGPPFGGIVSMSKALELRGGCRPIAVELRASPHLSF